MRNSPRHLQAHCQSHTSPSTDQSFVKELAKPTQEKLFLKNFPALQEKKRNAQPDTTMTLKLNTDNGLQRQTTEHQPVTAVWRNGGFSASYDSFVVGSSAVLRLNFCAKN
ncbi:MAG: hypothetical protein JST62_14645, partial [Bacteroidetes bacterium]|nr:hypothetical protein [Bacteroidota bacterium]